MSSTLTITEEQQSFLTKFDVDAATWHTLQHSIFPGALVESILLAVQYCKARKLDVLKKPVHIVPMYIKDAVTGKSGYRDVIMPGIYEHRTTAARTGQYAGQDAPVFGENGKLTFGETEHSVPDHCTVTVYRLVQGTKVSFSHTEYFEEACATKKDGSLNSMWTKRKRGQLSKCAEAGALRKAFPDELGGVITAEEMTEQTGYDADTKLINAPPDGYISENKAKEIRDLIGDDAELMDLICAGFSIQTIEDISNLQSKVVIHRIGKYKQAQAPDSYCN